MKQIGEIIGSNDDASWFEAMKTACDRSIADNPEKEGDFMQDGFLHCGVCKEAKREDFEWHGFHALTSRDCKCIRDAKKREEEQKNYEERMAIVDRLRANSLMDEMFFKATFKNFDVTNDNRAVYNACIKYCKSFGQMLAENQGLLFHGPVGTGKSFTAACIGNYIMGCLKPVIMTSFVKLLPQFSAFKENDERDLIKRLCEPDLLIIDDLGAERSTDFSLEKVYNVIDSRYRVGKPIILTTNLTLKEMKENTDIRYARIYDRVFEMCYPMKCDGASRRRIEARDRFNKMKSFFEGDD